MNICLLICSPYPPLPHGGVGSFAVDLAEGMANAGHQITVISLTPGEYINSNKPIVEMINDVRIIRVPPQFKGAPTRIQAVLFRYYLSDLIHKLNGTTRFDVLEGEDAQGMLALGRLPGIPKIVRLHASQIYNDHVLKRKPSRLNHIFEKLWIHRADFIIAVSDYVGATTFRLLKMPRDAEYKVIHYAIDTDLFKPDPGVAVEPGLILFTGIVAPRKGVLTLILAMNRVFEANNHAHLVIVGDDQYPYWGVPYSKEMMQHLDNKYADRVKFAGPRPRHELPGYLQRAQVCCFPSHVETFGIGIAEAMAMEKAVIYMKTGPGAEVVEDGVSGMLCDTFDPVDVADKILFALSHDDVVKTLGQQARARVLDKFEKNKWVRQNIDFYQDCIKGVGRKSHI